MEDVVEGCGGLPLTLEVVGKYLRGESSVKIWDEILDAMRNAETFPTLEERGWRKLQLSYDALGDAEKHMFLDIASFLLLEVCPFSFQEVWRAWSSMFTCVHKLWKTLVDKSLVQVQEGISRYSWLQRLKIETSNFGAETEPGGDLRIVQMHEHLRRMGQRIAKELPGRYVSMMDSQWGGNTTQLEKVVALRDHFSPDSDGNMDRSDDNPCSPCEVHKFFSRVKTVCYLDLATTRCPPISCEK